jgi:hypothetical protein
VGLANLGSELETCVGSRVHLVGVSISFEKNFYRLPFTPPLSGSPYRSFRLFGSHGGGVAVRHDAVGHDDTVDEELGSWKRKACGGLASLAAAAKNSWRRGNGRRGCRASLVEGLGVS